MCDQQYDVLWWSETPLVNRTETNETGGFDGVIVEQFFAAFRSCCKGNLPNFKPHEFENQELMMQQVRNMTIALPVSYETRVAQDDPGVFLRILDSAGMAFVTQVPKVPEGNLLTQGVETVWPLLLLILLTCGYAGLAFWLAEFTVKKEQRQIDRSFFKGLFDGYWCAFITATTVGYGDKVTGSRFGKLITIIWLLFGLGLMASFTAALTQIMSSSYLDLSKQITMKDCKNIGVRKGSLEQQMVIERGLKPVVASNFEELHELLENQTIDGFVIDQYYLSYHLNQIGEAFAVAMGESEAITSGVIYSADCPTCDTLNSCMRRYLFVRSLDYSHSLEEKLNRRIEQKTSALDMATQALGSDHTYLAVMGGILAALLTVTWAVDFTATRLIRKCHKRAQERSLGMQADSAVGEVLINK